MWGKLISSNATKISNIDLNHNEVQLGRDSSNDFQISDVRVSSKHCKLSYTTNRILLQDLSTNGTYLNGQKIGKGNEVIIKNGDEIKLLNEKQVGKENQISFILVVIGKQEEEKKTEETKGNDIEEEILCTICDDVLYQAIALVPCMHNFCGYCYTEWKKKNPICPNCRVKPESVQRNITLTNIINKYLEKNPTKKRSEEEMKRMNQGNSYTLENTKNNQQNRKKLQLPQRIQQQRQELQEYLEDIDSNDSSYNSNNNSENGIIISDDNSQREIGDELSELDSDGDHEGDQLMEDNYEEEDYDDDDDGFAIDRFQGLNLFQGLGGYFQRRNIFNQNGFDRFPQINFQQLQQQQQQNNRYLQQAFLANNVANQRNCLCCQPGGFKGYQCQQNQQHIGCQGCGRQWPNRQLTDQQNEELKVQCQYCKAHYCNLINENCKVNENDRMSRLIEFKDIEIVQMNPILFRNKINEYKQFQEYLQGRSLRIVLQYLMENYIEQNLFTIVKDKSLFDTQEDRQFLLTKNTPICTLCKNHIWFQLILRYIMVRKEEIEVYSRKIDCRYGINCRTISLNHQINYNHMCEQTYFQ